MRQVAARATLAAMKNVDWSALEQGLDRAGCSVIPALLEHQECDALAAMYARDEMFRSRVVMARHGFGRGEYKYFSYALPPLIEKLRTEAYPHLVPIANRWNETLRLPARFPDAR